MKASNRAGTFFAAILAVSAALVAAGAAPPAWAAPAPSKRPEAQQEYWARYEERNWAAAVEEAHKLVAKARENSAQEPLGLATALTLLGNAQLGSEDPANAEASYREALAIVEQHAGTTSAQLLDPVRGLGYTLAVTKRHKEAVPHLERALVIAHRSYGLFDIQQQGLLRQLATSLAETGQIPDAERHMVYLQRVGERAYGRRDPRHAALLCVIGDWYVETGNFMLARERYRTALDIVERRAGKSDPAVVEPLRALARSYVHEIVLFAQGYRPPRERSLAETDSSGEPKGINPRYINSDGEKALERALKVLEPQSTTQPQLLMETLIQMGDWFQIKHQPDKALPYYRRAAALVSSIPPAGTATPGPAPLSFPVRIYYPMPVLAMRNRTLPEDQVEEKYVEVQFTVTDSGDVEDAKITERNGSARQASEALQAIRAARYRPKFVDGQPVDTQGMVNREVFKTRKQTEDGKDS